jgi:hypothetical protein
VPRGTQDLDVWIEPTPANAERVWKALIAFGAPVDGIGITRDDLRRPETVIQLGLPPNRIDLLTSLTGLRAFGEAWTGRVEQRFQGRNLPFLGRDALIRNKRAVGRRKDLADLEALGVLPPEERPGPAPG